MSNKFIKSYLHWFGIHGSYHSKFFSGSVQKKPGHPHIISHANALAWTDLKFPLSEWKIIHKRLWAVSSPLADLSFHIPVLFYNDSSSSVIISHQLASLFEKELELNSLDWNVNELEHKHQLEDMKPTVEICTKIQKQFDPIVNVLTSLCVRKRSQKVVQHQRRQQGMTLGVRTREEMILQ